MNNNHEHSKQITNGFHSASLSKAGFVVITDESEDDFNYYCYLIKYMSKKLNDLGIVLSKTFFITRHDFADVLKQVNSLLNANGKTLNWLIVTTTTPKNDPLLKQLINELKNKEDEIEHLSSQLVVYKKILFLVNNDSFFESLAHFGSHVIFNNNWKNLKFSFNNKNELMRFLDELKNIDVDYTQFKSSYSEYAIQVCSKSVPLPSLSLEKHADYFLNNNFINADYLVYNFATISRNIYSLSTDSNNNDDLKFLSNKIDLAQLYGKLDQSLKVIEKTLAQSNPNQTCLSFNGGKDCCVVLYLLYACACRLGIKFPLNIVIIKISHTFNELEDFIFDEVKQFYQNSLEYIVLEDTSKTLKESLYELKKIKPNLNYILMGTRRTDAIYFKTMNEFAPTDADWPSFVRVNPILDWTYSEIWYFIKALKLPYCELYNRGYTSIDNCLNTVPNKALFDVRTDTYLPAYRLENEMLERNSRIKVAK